MKNTNVSLLKDFSSYSKSLPVREFKKEFLKLFELNYYARPKDVTDMALAITAEPAVTRKQVRYISAPSGYGKTASVLLAFLSCQTIENNGTHYFYLLAFTNNADRSFESVSNNLLSSDKSTAECQCAAFIFECVKTLLERSDDIESYKIKIEETPKLSLEGVTKAMNKYFAEKLGENCRIWFHVDEHGEMCDRSPGSRGNGAAFSFGAMTAFARVDDAIVIATYIERPVFVPALGSSKVCRVPIALPSINVNQVMKYVKELSIDSSQFGKEYQKRLLSSMKVVRLGFKLRGRIWCRFCLTQTRINASNRKVSEQFC